MARYFGIPADIGHTRKAGGYDAAWGHDIAKRYTMTEDMRERVYRENGEDYELYTWARGQR